MADWNALLPAPPAQSSNLLSDPAKVLGLLGQANQLKLFDQIYQARQGVGDAYKENVAPDGTVDAAGLRAAVAQRGGFLAPETMTAVQSQEGQRIQNATAAFGLAGAQNRTVLDAIGTLADKPNLQTGDVHNLVGALARNTGIPASILNGWASTAPKDPAKLREWLVTTRNMATGAANTQGQVIGSPTVGGEPRTISQGQANYQSAGVGPDNSGTANAPIIPKLVPTTTIPPPTGITVGLPPGSEKSSAMMQDDLSRARNFGQEIYPWTQALEKLKALGPGGTGPGSKGRQEFESFVYSASPSVATMMGVNPEKVKNYAEAEKYLTNATQQRAQNFGSHTDMQLSTALTGSPSVHINDLAAVDVTKAAIALRRMEHVQTLANAGDPVNYSAKSAKFAASQSPAAYMIDVMTPDQISRLDKNMTGQDRSKFNKSLGLAIKYGAITPDGPVRDLAIKLGLIPKE